MPADQSPHRGGKGCPRTNPPTTAGKEPGWLGVVASPAGLDAVGAFSTIIVVGLAWWSFGFLSRQVMVGANPLEIARQSLEAMTLGMAWLGAVAVGARAAWPLVVVRASTAVVPTRVPAAFPSHRRIRAAR